MARLRVLVTGFEPFGTHTTNISQTVAQNVSGHHRHPSPTTGQIIDVEIESCILSVDELGANRVANRLLEGERWDAVIHLGLCESCEVTRVEVRGHDELSMRIPDNAGRQLHHAEISGQGTQGAVVDPSAWSLDRFKVPVKVSYDAGRFICNEAFHRTLLTLQHMHDGPGLPPPCLFVHLPTVNHCSVEEATRAVMDVMATLLDQAPSVHVVAGVVPSEDGRYLIAQRSGNDPQGGTWEFPGGKMERGESWKEATVREWREEMAIDVEPLRLLGIRTHLHDGVRYHVHAVMCQPVAPTIEVHLHDHLEWTWWLPVEERDRLWTGRDAELASELR